MIKLKNILTKILEVICVIMFAFITIVGTYQIVTRYVFNAPSTVSEELLTYSFTWLALLAAALVFAKREHMRMGFLADKFSGNALRWIYIFSELLVILFAALIMIYVIVPICGIFVILFGVINIYELLRAKEVKPLSAKKETVISNKSAVVQKAIVKGDK